MCSGVMKVTFTQWQPVTEYNFKVEYWANVGFCMCSGAARERTSQTEKVLFVCRYFRQVVSMLVEHFIQFIRVTYQTASAAGRGARPRAPRGPACSGRHKCNLRGRRSADGNAASLLHVAAQCERRTWSIRRRLTLSPLIDLSIYFDVIILCYDAI